MQIHAIQTGTVQITENWRRGKGHGLRRTLNAIFDPHKTPPLPIYAWLIEHPEGLIVVDTGETARATQPGYFPWWQPTFRLSVRENVQPEEEIGPQLQRLGFAPRDVRWVVMTHLHTDHAGGLHHFPNADILVTRNEYALATNRWAKLRGYVPNRWPSWFAPRFVEFADAAVGPFPTSHTLTQAGDVHLIPTPGHTAGHLSVMVHEGERAIVLAGDVSYTQALLQQQVIDGVAFDEKAAHQTIQRMLTFAQTTPTVYLPSHDPAAAQRLAEREPMRMTPGASMT